MTETIVVGRFYLRNGTRMMIDPPLTLAVSEIPSPQSLLPAGWLQACMPSGEVFAVGPNNETLYSDILVALRHNYTFGGNNGFHIPCVPAATD